MTERQKKFAEYYAQCGNAAEAARRAGYSESYAAHRTDEMLRNVEIMNYIRELTEKTQSERILTAVRRQEILSELAEDHAVEVKDRIKAIDVLNKMTGEYTVKVDASVQSSEKLADVMAQIGGKGLTDGD
ncbi:MAG: terminase small subunit [Butyricicoccaceae bacterium]